MPQQQTNTEAKYQGYLEGLEAAQNVINRHVGSDSQSGKLINADLNYLKRPPGIGFIGWIGIGISIIGLCAIAYYSLFNSTNSDSSAQFDAKVVSANIIYQMPTETLQPTLEQFLYIPSTQIPQPSATPYICVTYPDYTLEFHTTLVDPIVSYHSSQIILFLNQSYSIFTGTQYFGEYYSDNSLNLIPSEDFIDTLVIMRNSSLADSKYLQTSQLPDSLRESLCKN